MDSYSDRARRFIERGNQAEDQLVLLRECVADQGDSALRAVLSMAEDMYGGQTFNFLIKAPAAFALLAFGARGLCALREMAERSPTSKNVSLCLANLAAVAAGSLPFMSFTTDEPLIRGVSLAVAQQENRDMARAELRDYVLGIADESDAISAVGTQLSRTGWGEAAGVAAELFGALAARNLVVSPGTLRAYENLMQSAPDNEPAFHDFFERHPQLLEPTVADVWSKPNLSGARQPDFVIRRMDDSYLIIEIESPGKPLMTNANQLSALATQAIAQATGYRAFLIERYPLARDHFPRFTDPDCLVVIGSEATLTAEQRNALQLDNRSRANLRVVGFDWIASRAHTIFRNVVEDKVTLKKIRVF